MNSYSGFNSFMNNRSSDIYRLDCEISSLNHEIQRKQDEITHVYDDIRSLSQINKNVYWNYTNSNLNFLFLQ